MEIRVLNYFLTVAQEESITNAADQLHITQPTLSRQIAELENELHTTLFNRTNRKTLLTDEGLRLKQHAEEILALVDKTTSEFEPSNETIHGTIHLGAAETNVIRVITDTFYDMQQMQPKINYNMYSGTAYDVMERLNQGLLDFGLLLEPVNKEQYEYIPMPLSDTLGVLMKKENPYASHKGLTVEDLMHIPLLMPARIHEKAFGLNDWLGQDINLNNLQIAGSYNLIYNASHMVSSNVSCALTISCLVNTTADDSLCFVPLQPPTHIRSVLVWKKYRILSKSAKFFLDNLKEKIKQY